MRRRQSLHAVEWLELPVEAVLARHAVVLKTRPICSRCSRLKLRCEGLSPYSVFINGLSLVEILPEKETAEDQSMVIPAGVSPNSDELFMTHLMKSLFITPQTDNNCNIVAISPWVLASLQPDRQKRSAALAVRAAAAAYYGKLYRHHCALTRGATLYTMVLGHVQRDINDPVHAVDTITLANTMFLALYEMITFTDTTAWLTHFLGIGQLIKFRGPHRHQTRVEKELFLTVRYFVVLAHLIQNQRCFLEDRAWKLVPWASDPGSKMSIDYILDIFCDVPGILDDVRWLQTSSPSTQDGQRGRDKLCIRFNALFKRLLQWRANWEAQFSDSCFSVALNTLRDLKAVHLDTYPFLDAVFFTKTIHVAEMCLYNSVLVILHRAWNAVSSSTNVPPSFDTAASDLNSAILLQPGKGSLKEITREICRMVYYQLLFCPGHIGAIQLILPVQVAYQNVVPDSEEAHWLSKIISHIAHSHGFEAMRYFQSSVEPILFM
ncbi:hypothetical protein BDV26DRAFT_296071 [Aspergillus bertholletiae]|uniref:Zn(2)-C6 fungal-type domain-containing protein n=1 Tax=Aspergillus bertholletiae TaxID=1226010 RepID=A0A5N7AWY8_9EURO|nr:hypothetical protein BDV26DRAFT_296071 [Aspergillus bertholletiae]